MFLAFVASVAILIALVFLFALVTGEFLVWVRNRLTANRQNLHVAPIKAVHDRQTAS